MFISLDIYIYDEKFVLKLFMNSGWYLINSLVNWPISCYDWRGILPKLSKEFYIIDQHYWRQLQYIKLLHFISSFWLMLKHRSLHSGSVPDSPLFINPLPMQNFHLLFLPLSPFLLYLSSLFSCLPVFFFTLSFSIFFFCLALTFPTFLFILPFFFPFFHFFSFPSQTYSGCCRRIKQPWYFYLRASLRSCNWSQFSSKQEQQFVLV